MGTRPCADLSFTVLSEMHLPRIALDPVEGVSALYRGSSQLADPLQTPQ